MNTAFPSKLIDGFENMTKQQLLDLSVAHLLGTRKPGVRENTSACVYSGSGCGAAPFIKEAFRGEADREGSWEGVSAAFGSHHEMDFIMALQRAHDDAWGWASRITEDQRVALWFDIWKRNIKMIALATGLTCPSEFY